MMAMATSQEHNCAQIFILTEMTDDKMRSEI